MKIQHNTLFKVTDADLNSNETFLFPKGITEIGSYAFYGCRFLKRVEIPENVTKIGKSAFSCCGSLKEVRIKSTTTQIPHSAFSMCPSLKHLTIGNIDVMKIYKASNQSINGINFSIYDVSDAALFSLLNDFYIRVNDNECSSMRCKYQNNTFSIENATPEAKKYAQFVLMKLLKQVCDSNKTLKGGDLYKI